MINHGTNYAYTNAIKVTILISLISALILPVGYFSLSYRHVLGFMEASANINAELVSRLISANPSLWQFETLRIEELLTSSKHKDILETKRVYTLDNTLVAEARSDLHAPFISVIQDLNDNGIKVGRIEVIRSIRPLVAITVALSLVGCVVGLLMYRWMPYSDLIVVGKQLQESNLFLNELQRIARVGGWKANTQTDYFMVTDGVFDICEIPKDKPPLGLEDGLRYYLPEYIPVLRSRIQRCLETGEPFTEICRTRTRNGRILWTEVRGLTPVLQGADRVVIGTLQDIDDRIRIEEELLRKNADLGQFIYTVSHDLRSPLVTFKTFLGFLENDMISGNHERVSQDLKFIHTAADKMKLLLDDLLEISRIDHTEMPHIKVTLKEIVAEVLDALAGDIVHRNLMICLPDREVVLCGDRTRLIQIWQNLLENAIKYSSPDRTPRIEAGVRLDGDETIFYVRDNGIGINPCYGDKIFGIFEKLNPNSDGAGMGLSMVRRIVEKYGGRIWVDSEEGKGASFNFTLPSAVRTGHDSVADGNGDV